MLPPLLPHVVKPCKHCRAVGSLEVYFSVTHLRRGVFEVREDALRGFRGLPPRRPAVLRIAHKGP
jgi:hypothetical protein